MRETALSLARVASCFFGGWALFGAAIASCGAPPSAEGPAEVSSAPYGASQREPATAPKAPERWSSWEALSSWPAVARPGADLSRFPSLGHDLGRYQYSVHLAPNLVETYQQLVVTTELPLGTEVLMRHFDAKSGDPGPLYVMRKEARGWSYAILSNTGDVLPTDTSACAQCHAAAPTDHLFGLPRDTRR